MLDITLFILFIAVSFRVASTVRREAAIFDEFGQSKNLAFFVFLLPVGQLALLTLPRLAGVVPAVFLAFSCYLSALLIARQRIAAFERSGTDRTAAALKSANETFGAALIGMIYVTVAVVLAIGIISI